MEKVIITNNLNKLCKEKNISQEDFAKAVGITLTTLLQFELGRYTPSLKHAFKMSKVLETPIEEIFSYKRMLMIEIE